MNNGIIYLNAGTKMLPRLLVSIFSLRKYYTDKISIIQIGDIGLDILDLIQEKLACEIIYIPQELRIKHSYWFEKARLHHYTKYDNNLFLDSDTLILNPITELFDMIKEHEFIVPQFAHWTTANKKIQKRLSHWKDFEPQLFDKAISSRMPSINVGVYGFIKTSELMANWFDLTIKNVRASLPEESTCHLLLNKYPSKIIDSIYNYSCKHDKKHIKTAKIIHYHGRKHCRKDQNNNYIYNSIYWVQIWQSLFNINFCDVRSWYKSCGDSHLNKL